MPEGPAAVSRTTHIGCELGLVQVDPEPVALQTTLPSEPNPQRTPPVCPNPVVVCGASVSGALPRKHLPHIVCFDSTNATTDPLQKLGIVSPTCSCGCCPLWEA